MPPNRLLALLGQALKWQQQGLLPAGAKFDLLRGGAVRRVVEKEDRVTAPGPTIKFGKNAPSARSSRRPVLRLGLVDGFLEVWDLSAARCARTYRTRSPTSI